MMNIIKKLILNNFLEDARKYYDKKEDNEIICKILKMEDGLHYPDYLKEV